MYPMVPVCSQYIGSVNGLVPNRKQAITWTNVRDSEITVSYIIYPLNLKKDSSVTNYLCPGDAS